MRSSVSGRHLFQNTSSLEEPRLEDTHHIEGRDRPVVAILAGGICGKQGIQDHRSSVPWQLRSV
jgi:hypothetical protein